MSGTADEIKAVSSRSLHQGWAMYDWANSAYTAVMLSTIFPTYYVAITTVTKNGKIINDKVSFFGHFFKNSSLYDYTIAAAYLIIACLSPILGAIADYKGAKKRYMRFFCYLGSLSCCSLYFFKTDTLEFGIVALGMAAISSCGSIVFYHAYLPEIATQSQRNTLSARGFMTGFVGGMVFQAICLLFVLNAHRFGIADESLAPRVSFLMVGLWWFGFAQITFARLPKGTPNKKRAGHHILVNGFIELTAVWKELPHLPVLRRFLGAFFFYSFGVQTVLFGATIFASKELKMGTAELIGVILAVQVMGIFGAWLAAKLCDAFGNLRVVMYLVLLWAAVCIAAYFTVTVVQFYVLAVIVGVFVGGIQSQSRSTYAKLMPVTHDTASYFSFYDVTEKLAIVSGTITFGYIDSLLNMRIAILTMVLPLAMGACLLAYARRK